jgi:hypothetical protein
VLLDGRRAVGIRTATGDEIGARRVIVAAGTIHSPAILQRSGIGLDDGRAVGANLKDPATAWLALSLRPAGRKSSNDGPVIHSVLRYSSGLSEAGPNDMQTLWLNSAGPDDLYVCDDSVMPDIPKANTHTPHRRRHRRALRPAHANVTRRAPNLIAAAAVSADLHRAVGAIHHRRGRRWRSRSMPNRGSIATRAGRDTCSSERGRDTSGETEAAGSSSDSSARVLRGQAARVTRYSIRRTRQRQRRGRGINAADLRRPGTGAIDPLRAATFLSDAIFPAL